jgi:hypothetical protein
MSRRFLHRQIHDGDYSTVEDGRNVSRIGGSAEPKAVGNSFVRGGRTNIAKD